MDRRLKQLSYSSRLTLHKCPRKYQLYKLNSRISDDEEDIPASVTFAFGHALGAGVQSVLCGHSRNKVILDTFLAWSADPLADDVRRNKSIWLAIHAIQKFLHLRDSGFLADWELLYHEGKPAIELPFIVNFPDGFTYKGFVDAVLKHKETDEIMVLEVKSTSMTNLNAATYKNSSQAIGYSIVLDVLVPTLSSYKVLYLVYKTKEKEYDQLPFDKDYLSRALWIREILLDIEFLKMCDAAEIYPMHGESCYSFYRECEYLGICTLSTAALTVPHSEEVEQAIDETNNQFSISISLTDLIQSQLEKENI